MKLEDFTVILREIEGHITPLQVSTGGNKGISTTEELTLRFFSGYVNGAYCDHNARAHVNVLAETGQRNKVSLIQHENKRNVGSNA